MKTEESKSTQRTCEWCDKPLKQNGDWDGVCSTMCAILSGKDDG